MQRRDAQPWTTHTDPLGIPAGAKVERVELHGDWPEGSRVIWSGTRLLVSIPAGVEQPDECGGVTVTYRAH